MITYRRQMGGDPKSISNCMTRHDERRGIQIKLHLPNSTPDQAIFALVVAARGCRPVRQPPTETQASPNGHRKGVA